MPKQKDLKRLVRARMQKTGESYTAARLHLVKKVEEPEPDYAKRAGMSDDKVTKATGGDWKHWVGVLDQAGGTTMSHREMTQYLAREHHAASWWTQMLAVGYERIRGLRARGQRRSGDWSVTKSKTVGVPVAKLFAAFKDAKKRAKWLTGATLTVKTATPSKSLRARWEDGTAVAAGFFARGKDKSQVAIEHSKLPTKADADRMRAFWTERLDALASLLKA